MKPDQTLPLELVWQDDGHASEVALAAIADGEVELVPDQVASHVGACDACTARLGEQALLSLSTGEALAEAGLTAAPARRPLPVLAIALALCVAALGAAPAVVQLLGGIAGAPEVALRGVLLTTRAGSTLIRALASADSSLWAVAWTAASVVLVSLGLLVARASRRQQRSTA